MPAGPIRRQTAIAWDEIKHQKIMESSHYIERKKLRLSEDPMKKVLEIGKFLWDNSTYEEGERGAAKAILPKKIQRKLMKNTPRDFPVYGRDRKRMKWKLTCGQNVYQDECKVPCQTFCSTESHETKTAQMLSGSKDMTEAQISGLTFQNLDILMRKWAKKKMSYTLSLGHPSDTIIKRLRQYSPDSFKDYLRCHHQYVCHCKGPELDPKCRALATMPGLATSIGIVSPPGTMTGMHPEDSYLCSINLHVLGGLKIWIIIDSDELNYNNYRQLLAEVFNDCPNLTREKKFVLRLPMLVNNKIRFGIIFQRLSELVITNPTGEHQVLNPQASITIARNVALRQNIDVFTIDEDLFECECPNAHFPQETEHLQVIMEQLYLSNWMEDLRNAYRVDGVKEAACGRNIQQQMNEPYSKNLERPSGGKSKKFRCNECFKSFTRKTTLTEHVKVIHLKNYGSLMCDRCGKLFSRKRNLVSHERTHNEVSMAFQRNELVGSFVNDKNVKVNINKMQKPRLYSKIVGQASLKICVV